MNLRTELNMKKIQSYNLKKKRKDTNQLDVLIYLFIMTF